MFENAFVIHSLGGTSSNLDLTCNIHPQFMGFTITTLCCELVCTLINTFFNGNSVIVAVRGGRRIEYSVAPVNVERPTLTS